MPYREDKKKKKKKGLMSTLRDLRRRIKKPYKERKTYIGENVKGENRKWMEEFMKTGKP